MAARATWTAPSNGGASITDYRLERKRGTGAFTRVNASGTALTYLDTLAANGDIYRVAATNSAGTGSYSTERTYVDPNAGGGGGGGGGATVVPNYWASPTGSDTNSGSSASPFRTIQRLFNALGNGQVGGVRSGTYDSGSAGATVLNVTSSQSGTQTAPRRLVGGAQIGEPSRAIVRGYVTLNGSYVGLEGLFFDMGFRISSAAHVPFRIGGSSGQGQFLHDCEYSGGNTVAQGILVGGGSFACNNVRITGCVIHDIVAIQSAPGHGVYHQNGNGFVCQGNVFYNIGNQAQWGGNRCVQLYPRCNGAVIRYNTMDTFTAGIVWGVDTTSGLSGNHTIEFNIMSNHVNSASGESRGTYTATGSAGNVIRSPHHHNLMSVGSPDGTSYSGTTTTGDPLYVSRSGRNYRLSSGSPAAGKGAYASPTPPLSGP